MTDWLNREIRELLQEQPVAADFFAGVAMDVDPDESLTVMEWIQALPAERLEDVGMDREQIRDAFVAFMDGISTLSHGGPVKVTELEVVAGRDKKGNPEAHSLTLRPGEIVSIVGPTGSGKSRLLADIEWMAQGDTPTGRVVRINGRPPEPSWRFSPEHKLVAQLSQNMNFVMDLSVAEFVRMHAESRVVQEPEKAVATILEQANELAGEQFDPDTPVTALSGGQSRALMIADTAYLSQSPIVLIDEIENAGIDRKKALGLLVKKEKIVLMATHDPILALMADRRIVIRNGGIADVLETTEEERRVSAALMVVDQRMQALREALRGGERVASELVRALTEVEHA